MSGGNVHVGTSRACPDLHRIAPLGTQGEAPRGNIVADGVAHAGLTAGSQIVHVVRQFAPSVGGLEDCVLNLVRDQRDRLGLDSHVVTLDRVFTDPRVRLAKSDTIQGVPVTRLAWRGSSRYPLAPSVLPAIRHAGIVHVHGIDFFFDFLALTRAVHRSRLVASTHGGFFHSSFASRAKRIWFDRITRRSMRAYDAVVACSHSDAALFAQLDTANLHTIENGIDLAKFTAGPSAARHPKRILTFGRFALHKRIPALFALLAALRARDPEWELVVAGSPADQTAEALAQAAQQSGAAGAIRIRLAPSDQELADEIAAASWFASASAHEGFGIAAVEAASAGLVPVLSAIGPFASLLQRLGDGILFDPAEPDAAAADVIASALPSRDMALRHARIAAAAGAYGWQSASDAYCTLYKDCLSRRAAGAADVSPLPRPRLHEKSAA